MNRTSVVISRRWNNPEIRVDVTNEGIAVLMTLEQFMSALVQEAGSPALLLTSAALQKRLSLAAQQVVDQMKKETQKVM